jgi:putative membrane protein
MRTDAHAVGLLHASNQAEIQAGTVAQSRTQNADVRAFAAQMVRDHTQLDQQGSALATRLGLTPTLPDSTLPRMQTEAMTALGGTAGAATPDQGFDVAYMTGQVADHQRTLAIVDAAIAQAQNAELRTALQTEVRPAVAQHLQMAQQLLQKLGGR